MWKKVNTFDIKVKKCTPVTQQKMKSASYTKFKDPHAKKRYL